LFRAGWVQKYDFTKPTSYVDGERNPINTVKNQFEGVSFWFQIHPTGNYAYIVNSDRHYILRSDYDWDTQTFGIPYVVCGEANAEQYADGVGSKVRLANPRQGAFVKNEEYVERNEDDIYDFYFCDMNNHAIRKLTPIGRVETFAGRGNNGTWGYSDGNLRTEARFNKPTAIVYIEAEKCFYIADRDNNLIRKIAYEE